MNYFLSFILIIQQCLSEELLIQKYVFVGGQFFDKGQVEATNGDFNVDDPSNNRYSIIGTVGAEKDNYRDADGNFEFRLVWHYATGADDILIWKQSSWIDENAITGYEVVNIPSQSDNACLKFIGLARSDATSASYIDGNGKGGCWWNAICPFQGHGASYPGFNNKVASSNELYIRNGETEYDCSNLDVDAYLSECSTEFPNTANAVTDLRNELDDYKGSNTDKLAELEARLDALAKLPEAANSGLVTIDNNSTVLSTNNLLLLSLIINIFLAFIGFYMFLRMKKANNYGKVASFVDSDSENQALNN